MEMFEQGTDMDAQLLATNNIILVLVSLSASFSPDHSVIADYSDWFRFCWNVFFNVLKQNTFQL